MLEAEDILKENTRLKKRVEQLEETIKLLQQRRFGASSEKISSDQLGLFNESEVVIDEDNLEDTDNQSFTSIKSHERKSRPRVSIPDDLPCEDIIHDLPEEEKVCPKDVKRHWLRRSQAA